MKLIKLLLIHFADAFDNYILHHKFYKVCDIICMSNSWEDHLSNDCFYCRKFGTDSDFLKKDEQSKNT